LWIDPVPNAQLMLIQLLDYVHSHVKRAAKAAYPSPQGREQTALADESIQPGFIVP
jgi:hypothetical protein